MPTTTPLTTMFGYTPAAVHAAPPVPCRVATAMGSRFGSGGRFADRGATGWGPVPAAQGFGLTILSPADRKEVAAAAQAGAVWPLSSKPSEQMALAEPLFRPARQTPGAVHICPSV